MRILLLSCNTGEGHNATAGAIMEVLEEKGIQCRRQDVLACKSPGFSKFISDWHVRLYKFAPKLYDAGYRAFERGGGDPEDPSLVYDLLKSGAGRVLDLLAEAEYDAVVCTHIFAGLVMTEVRRAYRMRIPCYFVATDYTCYPLLEQCRLDGYFIPDEALRELYLRAGVAPKRLLPMGIPVRQAFYREGDRLEARRHLGLPETGAVVLLMCGSMGCGPVKKIALELAERLPRGATVVAVCGSNEKLYASLSELESEKLRVLGFTRRLPEYMDAADIFVTKPGGLSTTEAAAKHLPMVLFNTVGGCENRNFDFYLSRGLALGSCDGEEAVNLTLSLALQPELRQQLRERLRGWACRNSSREIGDFVAAAAGHYRRRRNFAEARLSGIPEEKRVLREAGE